MSWIVIEIRQVFGRDIPATYGPFPSQEEAEKRQRERHFDLIMQGVAPRRMRTWVTQLEEMPR